MVLKFYKVIQVELEKKVLEVDANKTKFQNTGFSSGNN